VEVHLVFETKHNTKVIHLKQGKIPVILKHVPFTETVSVGILVGAGSRRETPINLGYSHFVEHMIFKGTRQFNYEEINRFFEKKGAYINAFTDKHFTLFYVDLLKDFTQETLQMLLHITFESEFPLDEINKEREVILEEMASYEDNPEDFVIEEFYKNTYNSSYNGFPILGTEQTIKNMTREKILDYYQTYYHQENIIISITGNIEKEKIIETLNRYPFPLYTKKEPRSFLFQKGDVPFYKGIYESKKPIEQSHLVMGIKTPALTENQRIAYRIYEMLLGGMSSSRLFLNIREKQGLCYGINTHLHQDPNTGILLIFTSTRAQNTNRLIEALTKEIRDLEGTFFSEEELETGKNQLKSKWIFKQENISSLMTKGAIDLFFTGDIRRDDKLIQKIDAISLEELKQIHHQIKESVKESSWQILLPSTFQEKIKAPIWEP
jgi:predicted Zn-dependent peptidase